MDLAKQIIASDKTVKNDTVHVLKELNFSDTGEKRRTISEYDDRY